jgi:hypothetical protein
MSWIKYLNEGALSCQDFVDGHGWNTQDAAACYSPPKSICPGWVHVVLVLKRFVVQESVRGDEKQEGRSSEAPADSPV